ncbi:hypothetical protein BG011_000444 [Mortierella polycephala]|uniref:F-box domain-containing protein n=1 Tax=Mortierella polycephala TaxID=41804 RepID=A0A9P6TVU2_9FUNG|nr:hypothetical protein BG011_000444 [Mortierella polycephala]
MLPNLPSEIQDIILTQLSTQDLTTCARVSHGWSELALPYIWRSIVIDQRQSVFHRFKASVEAGALVSNGHLIRSLTTPYYGIVELFGSSHGKTCTFLVALEAGSDDDPSIEVSKPWSTTRVFGLLGGGFGSSGHSNSSLFGPHTGFTSTTAALGQQTGDNVTGPNDTSLSISSSDDQQEPESHDLILAVADPSSQVIAPSVPSVFGATTSVPSGFGVATSVPSGFGVATSVPSGSGVAMSVSLFATAGIARQTPPPPPPPPAMDLIPLVSVLQRNTQIKSLHLKGRLFHPGQGVERVVEAIPADVEQLEINTGYSSYSSYSRNTEEPGRDLQDDDGSIIGSPLLPPLSMEKIDVSGSLLDEKAFLQVLKRSPLLNTIHLEWANPKWFCKESPSAIRSHCTELRHLKLTYAPEKDEDLAHLIDSCASGWKSLIISPVQEHDVFGPLSTAALLKHCHSLEDLCLNGCESIASDVLQDILCSAPNLKRLIAMPLYAGMHGGLELKAQDMIRSEWACTGLETLRCIISDIPRPDIGAKTNGNPLVGPLHTGTMEKSRAIQREIYKQLGRLTKLRELGLGQPYEMDGQWSRMVEYENEEDYCDDIDTQLGRQYECLDFTLASGLDELKNLKQLKEVGLQGMAVGFFDGAAEQEWASKFWPNVDMELAQDWSAATRFRYDLE